MLTPTYIVSQIIVVIAYLSLANTYLVKNKKNVLIFNFIYLGLVAIVYLLLGAYTGMAMMGVAVVRNIVFLIRNKKGKTGQGVIDWIILVAVLLAIALVGVFTYQGFWSIFSLLATAVYSVAVWQKNDKLYHYFGIVSTSFWLTYNIFIRSVFGAILDFALLTAIIITKIIKQKRLKQSKQEIDMSVK